MVPVRAINAALASLSLALAVALALVLTISAPALAQSQPQVPSFTLDMAAPAAQQVALTVQAPTTVPLKILRGGGPLAGAVTLNISTFVDERGTAVPVLFSVGGGGGPGVSHLDNVSFGTPLLAVDLHVPALPAGGKYTGQLILSAPGVAAGEVQTTVWRFVLTSADNVRPATLVIDQSAVTLNSVRRWCFLIRRWNWCTPRSGLPIVTVHVRDKNGSWPLDGVTARLEPGLKAVGAGFDPKTHIRASFDGSDVPDIFAAAGAGERRVSARGQATITLALKDLAAGEYTIPIRFTAMNSGEDDAQRLTITLQVRNHVFGAILVLILAAFMSFLATRVVTGLRQRASFLDRVQNMSPAWLADEAPILPVIWVRATLRQVEHLSSRYLLSGQSTINARLTAVTGMLSVLDRVRQVRDQISMTILNPEVQRRALWKLDGIVQRLGAGPLNDQDVARFKGELDDLAKWCDPLEQEKCYWTDLQRAIAALCASVQVTEIPGDGRGFAITLLGRLPKAIQNDPQVLNFDGKIAAERDYGRLSILWELRSYPNSVERLIGLPDWPNTQIEQVYEFVDNFWWSQLQQPEAQLTVVGPPPDFNEPEAYNAITFHVKTRDPGLYRSFLMQKKLTHHWSIEIRSQRPFWALWLQPESIKTLQVDSVEPKIVEYSPRSGQLAASVCITYKGPEGPVVNAPPLSIRNSRDFSIWRAFEAADLLAFAAALIAAVISGVALYALAPSFGSAKDYLALFTWGASLDQGKNFLQSLAIYSSTPNAAA